ncbi:uncharacterized protein LOC129601697 isoform X2 [Paramacrobiotus metropolitanus]|uniref:uncharacterized protein LOC129601697 isoform X2 n=1 Tax=Paramacrobiotus metropolitanus TaxID=2943436 RepID=UPI002445630A|nr:uncharacterized protein LOC129601697 isoform X2 [Paramacrobiotus metropolitanus]
MALRAIEEDGGDAWDAQEDATDVALPLPGRIRRSSHHSDYSSTASISSEDTSPKRDRPQPPNTSQPDELAFCAAVGRPDREVVLGSGVDNELMTRVSKNVTHVLVRGTIQSMIDPLRCPFGLGEKPVEACVAFRAGMPQGLKIHLEGAHGMHNVQLNLACPCPAQFNRGVDCDYVQFDPIGSFLTTHMNERHPDYVERMMQALVKQRKKKNGEKHRQFLRTARSQKFPEGTSDLRVLWPSQITAEKIVIPTRVVGGLVKYVCKIDACAAVENGQGRLLDSSQRLFTHVKTQHGGRCALPTKLYHACADLKCPVQVFGPFHLMDAHIQAVHPHLLGLAYSETALQARARLEAQVTGQRIGEALSSSVDTEPTPGRFLVGYDCPVAKCLVCYTNRDYMLWHIGADHQDEWNEPNDRKGQPAFK